MKRSMLRAANAKSSGSKSFRHHAARFACGPSKHRRPTRTFSRCRSTTPASRAAFPAKSSKGSWVGKRWPLRAEQRSRFARRPVRSAFKKSMPTHNHSALPPRSSPKVLASISISCASNPQGKNRHLRSRGRITPDSTRPSSQFGSKTDHWRRRLRSSPKRSAAQRSRHSTWRAARCTQPGKKLVAAWAVAEGCILQTCRRPASA